MLLSQPGIGPTVIARIEAAGIHSIEALRLVGVHFVVEKVCLGLGTVAWSNRRSALARALERLASNADLGVPKRDTCPDPSRIRLQRDGQAPHATYLSHPGSGPSRVL